MKFNLRIFITFIFIIFLAQGHSQDSINQYEALRLKNELGFQKSYRVLKTTFKSLEGFQTIAAQNLGITALPTNFLIDSTGKIIAANIHGEELKNKIEELFK